MNTDKNITTNINLILNKIKDLENVKNDSENKFLSSNSSKKSKYIKQSKVKSYRMQQEHGEKKFIKPWRTGTKSQQQPPKSGKKSGGRGKQRG